MGAGHTHFALNALETLRSLRPLRTLGTLEGRVAPWGITKLRTGFCGVPLLVTWCFGTRGAGDGSADGDGIRTDGCAGTAGHTAAGIAAVLAGIAAT